uniref:Uncharacterized protein n=1 Tax=Cacopsylla melanoneura TaxID=428564 RepID=A0A8D9F907_9HEMI
MRITFFPTCHVANELLYQLSILILLIVHKKFTKCTICTNYIPRYILLLPYWILERELHVRCLISEYNIFYLPLVYLLYWYFAVSRKDTFYVHFHLLIVSHLSNTKYPQTVNCINFFIHITLYITAPPPWIPHLVVVSNIILMNEIKTKHCQNSDSNKKKNL